MTHKEDGTRRRWQDLRAGLLVISLVAGVLALLPAIVHAETGEVSPWWWLPQVIPAGMLTALLINWVIGDYLPDPAPPQE